MLGRHLSRVAYAASDSDGSQHEPKDRQTRLSASSSRRRYERARVLGTDAIRAPVEDVDLAVS
jgi:hypothetical protein